MIRPRVLPVLLALAVVPLPAAARDARIDKLLSDIQGMKAKFGKERDAAAKQVLARFDKLTKQTEANARLSAGDRVAALNQLEADRAAFVKKGYLPDNPDLLTVGWAYAVQLRKVNDPLFARYEEAMAACLKAKDTSKAATVLADREQFEKDNLPGRAGFAGGSKWQGTLYTGAAALPCRLDVTDVKDGQYKAELHYNLTSSGHPIFDVGGPVQGLRTEVKKATVKQGKLRLDRADGVLLGETLLVQLTTAAHEKAVTRRVKGQLVVVKPEAWVPTTGTLVLQKK